MYSEAVHLADRHNASSIVLVLQELSKCDVKTEICKYINYYAVMLTSLRLLMIFYFPCILTHNNWFVFTHSHLIFSVIANCLLSSSSFKKTQSFF